MEERIFLDEIQRPPSEEAIRAILERATSGGGERAIRCARCRQPVTSVEAKIEVDGAHEHTCTNPADFVFRVGCFRDAPGCGGVGPASEEWSWFPGYAWQIGICRGCGAHLGWIFRLEGARFFGLIVDRLIEGEGRPGEA